MERDSSDPSALGLGSKLDPFASVPAGVRLTADVIPWVEVQSETNTSTCPPVSPGARFVAAELYTTFVVSPTNLR